MDTNDTSVNETGSQSTQIGSRIRDERLKRGLSQNEFAKLAHVHRKTQINYETGERKPDSDYLLAIAGMGVDVEYILTGYSHRALVDGYNALLEEIMIELGLFKGFQPAWEAAFKAILADMEGGYSRKGDSRAGLDAVVSLVHKSPLLLKGPGELVDLLERVEFVAETGERRLSALQKAKVVYQLFQLKKSDGIDYIDLAAVRQAIEQVL